jgi:hypothetical protein
MARIERGGHVPKAHGPVQFRKRGIKWDSKITNRAAKQLADKTDYVALKRF